MTDDVRNDADPSAGLPELSPYVSVIWKPMHRLLGEGNPTDPTSILHFDLGGGRHLPFAAVSKTRRNRVVLWPPFDSRQQARSAAGVDFPIHHVTLELSNGQTHFTRFDPTERRVHENPGWQLSPETDGLRLWLVGVFHIPLLEQQYGALEQNVRMPTSDSARRVEESKRYYASLTMEHLKTPSPLGDYLIAVFYLPSDPSFRGPVLPQHFPIGAFSADLITGWTVDDPIEYVASSVCVGGLKLIVLTAAPAGRFIEGCCLGGPKGLRASNP